MGDYEKSSKRISDPNHKLHTLTGEEWEAYRQDLIEEVIAASRHPQKLRRLQWKIDGIIVKHSKMGAVVKINSMMHEAFQELANELNDLR